MAIWAASYKTVLAVLALSVLSQNVNAQAPASKPDPLAQSLIAVGDTFGFNPKKSGPFHLKAHFDIFKADGTPDGSGTLEEYGDGKGRLRRAFTYGGQTQTVWQTPALSVSGGDYHAPFFARHLIAGFEHPIPPASTLQSRTYKDAQQTMGTVRIHCILTRMKPRQGHPQPEATGSFGPPDEDDYCLSSDDRYLRVQQSFPGLALAYNSFYRFNGQMVPFAVTLTQGNVTRGEFHVDALEVTPPDDATFVPAPDAKAGPGVADPRDILQDPYDLTKGNAVSQQAPSYPSYAKQTHITGRVVMAAIISRQGMVTQLEVINDADRTLAPAALEAVKNWRYKPFLVDGVPTEVDTIITVTFAFGG